MLEFETLSPWPELANLSRSSQSPSNSFRITSLYEHPKQLPSNHIVSENMGGRGPANTQFRIRTLSATPHLTLGNEPIPQRTHATMRIKRVGIPLKGWVQRIDGF